MAWDFWSVLSVAGIGQTIVFLAFLIQKKSYQTFSGVLVFVLLLWVTWLQLEFLSIRSTWPIDFSPFYASRHGIWLAFGPLLYHYTSALNDRTGFSRNQLLHYVPFILFVIIIPLIVFEPVPYRAVHYGMLTIVKFPKMKTSFLQFLYGGLYFLQFAHAAVYILQSYRKVNHYQTNLKNEISAPDQLRLTWLKHLLIYAAVLMGMILVFLFLFLYTRWYTRELDYLYILPVTVIIYIFSYYALREPILFSLPLKVPTVEKYKNTALTEKELIELSKKLTEHLTTKKPYLDPELRLQSLASQLNVQPYELSQVINEGLGENFFDLVNEYRIEEACRLLSNPEHQNENILQIAFACGFNNKVSFNRYFKKYKGITPTAYQKKSK